MKPILRLSVLLYPLLVSCQNEPKTTPPPATATTPTSVATTLGGPPKWQTDLNILKNEVAARDDAFFINTNKADWQKALDATAAQLGGKSDIQAAIDVQKLLAKIGDPHTHVDLTPILQQEKTVPIGLGWYEGALYVSATVQKYKELLGRQILKIDDLEPQEAVMRLAPFIPHNNDIGLRNDALNLLRFPSVLQMAGIGDGTTLHLLTQDASGAQAVVDAAPLNAKTDQAVMGLVQFQFKNPAPRWIGSMELWTKEWLAQDNILYMRYNLCLSREILTASKDPQALQAPAFGPFVQEISAIMEKNPGAKLLIDLRFNSVGDDSDGLAWAQKLAKNPKINQKGKLYVAINSYTTGAAVQVAHHFDRLTEATLLGEPTGEKPNQLGIPKSISLPDSKMRLEFTSKVKRILPDSDPASLAPEVPVPVKFSDFKEGKDPVLEYVRAH